MFEAAELSGGLHNGPGARRTALARCVALDGTTKRLFRVCSDMRRLRSLAIVAGAVLVIVLLALGLVGLNDYLTCGDPPHFGCGPGRHSPSGSYTDCMPC